MNRGSDMQKILQDPRKEQTEMPQRTNEQQTETSKWHERTENKEEVQS